MFIRFVSGEIDEDSHVPEGLFCAAYRLLEETWLPDYEYEALREPLVWFTKHLKNPFEYQPEPARLARQSLCWFRPTAREHLHRAWEMIAILEEHEIYVRTLKCHHPGYILYEDKAQVLAYPYADTRRLL